MNRKAAEALATDALIWLSGQPEDLARFLALSGTGPADIRAGAAAPEFLGAVLDHLLTEDRLVIAFADSAGIDPMGVQAARAALPGGDQPHWT